jgi:hypothetical protein
LAMQLHLKDILDYEDLKSQVFQHFRELGNTLALFRVLGASISQWDCFTFVQSASFLGITPDMCKEQGGESGGGDGSSGGGGEIKQQQQQQQQQQRAGGMKSDLASVPLVPLVRHVREFVSQAKQCVGVMKGPALESLVDFSNRTAMMYGGHAQKQQQRGGGLAGSEQQQRQQQQQPADMDFAKTSANATREPLLRVALKCLKEALDEAEEEMRLIAQEDGDLHSSLWEDDGEPVNGVMHIEATQAFHRLFSALLFEFCEISRSPIPSSSSSASSAAEDKEPSSSGLGSGILPDAVEFGDGMLWGGCAIIHMLRQTETFRLLDFSGHVLGVSEWEGLHESAMVGAVDSATMKALPLFLRNARLARYRIDQLFKLFEAQRVLPPVEELVVFKPPLDDSPEMMGHAKVDHFMSVQRASHYRNNSSMSDLSVYGQGMSVITEGTLNYEAATPEGSYAESVSGGAHGGHLPEGWTAEIDPDSGDTFFVNEATGHTTWDRAEAFQ